MQINHIGINIFDEKEIKAFYQHILELHLERNFEISRHISKKFFGIDNETRAFIVKNEQVTLELFAYDKPLSVGYAHLCIEMDDREKTVRKCEESSYPIMRMKREKGDLLFVKDKAGNIFELKNRLL